MVAVTAIGLLHSRWSGIRYRGSNSACSQPEKTPSVSTPPSHFGFHPLIGG